jgi:hypothetical protein
MLNIAYIHSIHLSYQMVLQVKLRGVRTGDSHIWLYSVPSLKLVSKRRRIDPELLDICSSTKNHAKFWWNRILQLHQILCSHFDFGCIWLTLRVIYWKVWVNFHIHLSRPVTDFGETWYTALKRFFETFKKCWWNSLYNISACKFHLM